MGYAVIIATHGRRALLARALLSGEDVYIERGGAPGPARSRAYVVQLVPNLICHYPSGNAVPIFCFGREAEPSWSKVIPAALAFLLRRIGSQMINIAHSKAHYKKKSPKKTHAMQPILALPAISKQRISLQIVSALPPIQRSPPGQIL